MATKAVKRPRLLFKAISFAMAGAICAAPFSITFSVFLLNNRLNRIVDREMTDIPALFHYEQVFNDQNSEVIGSGVLDDYLQHKSLSGHRDGAFV